ncbi:hypothetical protein F4781DRAFT_434050 [Annulohypoxylon bovei var. microspora]|nr:hypothetical protein F4781DRAFT_434050 [Annulohypoxylon bovei var. microspora]
MSKQQNRLEHDTISSGRGSRAPAWDRFYQIWQVMKALCGPLLRPMPGYLYPARANEYFSHTITPCAPRGLSGINSRTSWLIGLVGVLSVTAITNGDNRLCPVAGPHF